MDWQDIHLIFKEKLASAYCEIIFLLDRGYYKDSVLNFVGNHYKLEKKYRNILNRASLPLTQVQIIEKKLVSDNFLIKGKNVYIDVYNQISTFFSLKNHDPIIICRDGMLRDIFSSIHRKKDLSFTKSFISSYIRIVSILGAKTFFFYFDKQRSHSREHANLFTEIFKIFEISGVCEVVENVDRSLKDKNEGIIFSHDSAVLEAAPCCFDFNAWYIKTRSSSNFPEKMFLNFKNINCN